MQKIAFSSGVAGFVAYIVLFVIGVLLGVAVSVLETFYYSGENLWVAISIFYGAILLVATAVQMYVVSNKHANVVDDIYMQVVGHSTLVMQNSKQNKQSEQSLPIVKKEQEKQPEPQKEKPIDSIDELRMVVNDLIAKGASKELLKLFKSSLESVAKTNFTSHVDNLRMKNIIEKLQNNSI